MKPQLDRIEAKLDQLYTAVVGEPPKFDTGLTARVTSLEQAQARRASVFSWFTGLIAANVVALISGAIYLVKRLRD